MKFYLDIDISGAAAERLLFTRNLAVMIKSGIPLQEAIEALAGEVKSGGFRSALRDIMTDVSAGKALSDAMEKHSHFFDRFYTTIVRVGEGSGSLEESMILLSRMLEKQSSFKKKVQSALLYPSIVIAAAFFIGGYIGLFILPRLFDFFTTLDIPLPLSTRVLIVVVRTMNDYGGYIISGIILLIVAGKILSGLPRIRPVWHALILSLPIYGAFVRRSQLTLFFRNLGTLMSGGVALPNAFEIQAQSMPNIVFQNYARRIGEAVSAGRSMSEDIFSKKYRFIPAIAVKMIDVGERTGHLAAAFSDLGDFFESELDESVKNFSTVIEPVLLIIIGLTTAFIAVSIISPIYQIAGSIK